MAEFRTIHVEGFLLPPDMLARLTSGKADLPGLSPESYHLSGERIREASARSWTRLRGAWAAFQEARTAHPAGSPTTGLTRSRWLNVLFQELGFGQLEANRSALSAGTREFPISHAWGSVPIHLVGYEFDLERRYAGEVGVARLSAFGTVQQFLNESDHHLWGIVSNGLRLRLLRDNVSLTRQAYVAFDLEAMMEGEAYADFVLLWMVLHQSRFEGEEPEECFLEQWFERAAEEGTQALERLRDGVEAALRTLGSAFVRHPRNTALRSRIRSGELDAEEYYRQLLRLVYRMVFLFVAEDRDVLLDPGASAEAKARYQAHYSTARLRRMADRLRAGKHGDLYAMMRLVMEWVGRDEGQEALGLYALNSFLFSQAAVRDLGSAELRNEDLLAVIRHLAYVRDRGVRRSVNFRLLGSREFGSVYESLLELHPALAPDGTAFELTEAPGHERKKTSSFYTHDALIRAALDHSLEPLLEEAAASDNAEAAILALKVLDPSVGSGHFLTAAAHRIAHRLAAARTGEAEPPTVELRRAIRDVIGHCLYGVDLNPMAAEICTLTLWLEGVEPGRPLSFLEHRIQVGNAMLGIYPRQLAGDIPDEAFAATKSDEARLASALRRRNRQERESEGLDLFATRRPDLESYDDLRGELLEIAGSSGETIEALREQEARWKGLVESRARRYAKRVADMWAAAFLAPKTEGSLVPTAATYATVRANPGRTAAEMTAGVDKIAEHYGLFHWHLAFPDVFEVPTDGDGADSHTGWRGGFDLVLGNPPWDTMSPDFKEFFAKYDPQVRFEDSDGQKRIAAELCEDPSIAAEWETYRRDLYASVHFIKNSGRYRLFAPGNLGKGDFNTYRFFVESALDLCRPGGYVTQVVPDGLYQGANAAAIRQHLFASFEVTLLYGFVNSREEWFQGVDTRQRFTLYVARKSGLTRLFRSAFGIGRPHELTAVEAGGLALPVEIVRTFSPDALSIMEFQNQREIDISEKMYTAWRPFGERIEALPHRKYMREIDMGSDRDAFAGGERGLPVYEGRMVSAYDHRAKGYRSGRGRAAVWEPLPFDGARKAIEPQWRVQEEQVPGKALRRTKHFRIGFCDVASARNERALAAALLPPGVIAGHKVPTISFGEGNEWAYVPWLAVANSFTMDYLVRMKVSLSMSYTIMDSLPFPRLAKDDPRLAALAEDVLRLTCTSREMTPFWNMMAAEGLVERVPDDNVPGILDAEERRGAVARLEAFVARVLYGLTRDELAYILTTFPIVERRETADYGEFRLKRMIMDAYEALGRAPFRRQRRSERGT